MALTYALQEVNFEDGTVVIFRILEIMKWIEHHSPFENSKVVPGQLCVAAWIEGRLLARMM
jgi:hypothetical protein